MRPTLPDRLARAAVVGLLALAAYVMLADFFNLRKAQQASTEAPVPLSELVLPQPWGGYGWRALARLAGDASRIDPATARDVLTEAGRRYPLDAVQWLDLARIHARDDEAGPVDAYLARAGAVQPFERRSLWAAAQVALQTGNAALAERQLRQWLRLYPRDTGQALFIGQRWIDDPGTLLDRMLPEGREYLAEAMQVARRQADIPLAEAVWARLAPKPGLDDPLFLNFVDLLLQTGEVSRAMELWAERDPDFRPGRLVNGDFSRPLGAPLALNWRINRLPPGVRAERDVDEAFAEPASLRVSFNGKENVHLGEPWIRIPVEPGQHYRISGAWRGEALTTRSLPYWYLTAEQGELRERKAVPGARFGWERWQIEFQAPEGTQLVRLQLRRDRTNAFDRNIDGTLWLDDFRLEPIAEPRTLQSAASEALGRQARNERPASGFRFAVSGEKGETVYGLRFTVYGENQGAGAADSEQGFVGAVSGRDQSTGAASSRRESVGAVSGRDRSAPETPPTKSDSSAQDAPPTATQPANRLSSRTTTGVGAASSREESVGAVSGRDDRGPKPRIASAPTNAAETGRPAREPESGNRKTARSAR